MSYCRFSQGNVYLFLNVGGFFDCCACWLAPKNEDSPFYESQSFDSTDAVIAHIREHIAAGHDVPDDVIPALEADREENDSFIRWGTA